MGAINRGPGRYAGGIKFKRLTSQEGIRQRQERRLSNIGNDDPAHGLHMIPPGSANPRKVGR